MAATPKETKIPRSTRRHAKTALVLAIVALLTSWLIVGGIVAIVALRFAGKAQGDKDIERRTSHRDLIYPARVLAVVAIIIALVFLIVIASE
jgi:heme/copper-type cytochrome/quinol oxidase subunit 2